MNTPSSMKVDLSSGSLSGPGVMEVEKRLSELGGIFRNAEEFEAMDADQVIYRVQYFQPIEDGTEGGLFWGNTTIQPGKVGDEFFMTKGHFHAVRDRGEYYLGVGGMGALLLMDESGTTRMEPMSTGTLHYIPGHTAHRVANTGNVPLTFLACWPSDAGHDYATIEQTGFTGRMIEVNGQPEFTRR